MAIRIIEDPENHLDEIRITDIKCNYAILWHQSPHDAPASTMLDIDLKRSEIKALYEALQKIFEVQTQDKAGNQGLPKTTSP